MVIFIPVAILGSVGLFFGVCIAVASKKLHVHIDARVEKIISALPGANCGACGFAGCAQFAKAVAQGIAPPAGCVPGGASSAHAIADVLGVAAELKEPVMAVVHCKGGRAEAKERSVYQGIADCNAAVIAGNGHKVCTEGCLGLGTCVRACPFDAIEVNDNGVAVVDPEKCTGCGKCVGACPRRIISLIPKVHKIFLSCSNHDRGAKVKKYCSVGCTACTLCVKATTSGAITMVNNLPSLDYSIKENFVAAANKCPSKCFTDLVKARPKANIDSSCNGCRACVDICPVTAITGEQDKRHVIDKAKCIGCGLCVDPCPVHAISMWGGLGYSASDKTLRQRA